MPVVPPACVYSSVVYCGVLYVADVLSSGHERSEGKCQKQHQAKHREHHQPASTTVRDHERPLAGGGNDSALATLSRRMCRYL